MHNIETRCSRPPNKRAKLKFYKNHKASCRVLKKYKVPRNLSIRVPDEIVVPLKFMAYDDSRIPKTVQAFLEASNRKKQTWVHQTPVKKVVHDEVLSEKDLSEENVYCDCKRPYSSGELMFKCEGFCEGWYHPECVKMKPDETERQKTTTERWYCPNCIYQAQKIVLDTSDKLFKKLKSSKNNV